MLPGGRGRNGGVSMRAILITLVILVTLVLMGLTVTGAVIGPSLYQSWQIAGLDSQAAAFLTPPAEPDAQPQAYIKGKLVLIDAKKGHIDPFYTRLPDDLIARSKDEVGTVVWIDWEAEAPNASVVANKRVPVCKLTIIDRERNQSLGEYTFPWDYTYTDPRHTMIQVKKPLDVVADYLKRLPRR
jgi:hypothetical protein